MMSKPKPTARHRTRPVATASGGHDPHRPIGKGNPPKATQFKKG